MTSRLLVDKIEGKTTASTVQMPSGSVIQAVTSKYSQASNDTTFSATSFTDSVSITFTPKFASSLIKHTFFTKTSLSNSSYTVGQDCRWLRDSTILSGQQWTNYFNRNTNPIGDYYTPLVWHYIDEPNTTNAIVYKFQGRSYGAGGSNSGWGCFKKNHSTDTNFGDHAGQWTIEEIAQ